MKVTKHFLTAGAVILNQQNKVLLKKDPHRGWELPGGHVEQNESLKETAIREIKEETGITVEITKFCGISQEVSKGRCNTWWLGKPVSGEFKSGLESMEIGYFEIEQALQMIQIKEFREEFLKCLDEKDHPFYISFI
ncbi:NUDIX hydrolase [Bacillus gobiensis]|uniref:NUDIX hydrolase n=1 Tax=Bacillus gobiensis TaxID=1441095 RepID=UPI003D1CC445